MNNLTKLVVVGAAGSAVASAGDKAVPRKVGEYPTAKRLAVVLAVVTILNYGGAWLEQKLDMDEESTKFKNLFKS